MRAVIVLVSCWSLLSGAFAEPASPASATPLRQIQVVDTQGRPVVGATVEGIPSPSRNPAVPVAPPAEWRGTTDERGLVAFPIADGQATSFLARKAGWAVGWLGWFTWEGGRNSAEDPARIELTPPRTASGTVRNVQGQPMPDVEVWVVVARIKDKQAPGDVYRYLSPQQARRYFQARTGADGGFRFEGLPPDATMDLAAGKPGWALSAPASVGGAGASSGVSAGIQLRLVPAGAVEGRVVEENTGAPLAGARVAPGWFPGTDPGKVYPLTGPDGFFRLTDLPPRRLQLRTGFGTNVPPEWVFQPVEVELTAGTTNRDVKIVASRGGFLEASVLSPPENRTLEGVRVSCFSFLPGAGSGGSAQTAAEGKVRFRVLPGQYSFNASKPGWVFDRATAVCELGQTQRVVLHATVAPRIAGVVRDATGQSASNVWVGFLPPWGEGQRTDRDGRFTFVLEGQAPPSFSDGKTLLLLRDPTRDLAATLELAIQGSKTNLQVQLEPGLTLTGRVCNEKDQGIPNASVDLRVERRDSVCRLDLAGVTDREGRFEIKGLPRGWRFGLEVSAPGYGKQDRTLPKPDPDARRLEVEPFDLISAVQRVAGVVLDESGKPSAGVPVAMGGINQPNANTTTDEQGRFAFEAVCPGAVFLNAQQQAVAGSVTVEAGDTNAIIRLGEHPQGTQTAATPRSRLTGTVLGTDGNGVPGVRLCLFPHLGQETEFTTDKQGRFQTRLASDYATTRRLQYALIALDPPRQLAASADLDEEATNVTLRLEPGWTWVGRATDPNGAAISNLAVRFLFQGATAARPLPAPVLVDPTGRFEITGLPQGRSFRVHLTAPGYGRGGVVVAPPESGKRRFESEPVILERANLAVGGVVRDAQGRPLEAVSVTSSGDHQPNVGRQTDAQGRFFFDTVCAGPVELSVNGPDGQFVSLTTEGGETNLIVRFEDPNRGKDGAPLPKVAGVVLGSDGQPVRGVQVILMPVNQYGKKTDGQGRFQLTLETGAFGMDLREFTLLATDRTRQWAASGDVDERNTNVTLRLEPAWTLTGRITNSSGASVTNAQVQLFYQVRELGMSIGQPVPTDRTGRYQIQGLAPGRSYTVGVLAKGHGQTRVPVGPPANGGRSLEAPPILLPTADRTLAGVVVDGDEQPVRGATVTLYSAGQNEVRGLTDGQGRFVFKGVCPGEVQVSASDAKSGGGSITTRAGDTNVVLRFGTHWRGPEATASTARKIPGLLLDAEGKPVPEARLLVAGDSYQRTTDAQGRFTLVLDRAFGEDGGAPMVVLAQALDRQWAASLGLDEDATNANLRFEPAWTLAGRVLDTQGVAVTNARAELSFRGVPVPPPLAAPALADREGRFEIPGLPDGRAFGLNVTAKGYGRATLRVDPPEPGGRRVEVEPVRLAAANLAVSGVVLDERDQPVRGATVQCYGAHQAENPQRSDQNGRFTIQGLCPGRVHVSANDTKGRYAGVSAQAGDTQVVLRLVDATREVRRTLRQRPPIAGSVVDPEGRPAGAVRLRFLPSFGVERKTDAQGGFKIDPSRDGVGLGGALAVVLAQDEARNLAATLELEEETTNAVLRLQPAWTLSGRVTAPQGATLTNARAQLVCRAGSMSSLMGQPLPIDREGRFEFKGLPAGYPFEVTLSAEGFGRARVPVEAPAEGVNRKEIDPVALAPANLTLGGQVLDDQGRPARGISVYCQAELGRGGSRETDREGRFLFRRLAPGRCQVSAGDENRRHGSAEAEAGATKVVIRLSAPPSVERTTSNSLPPIRGLVTAEDGSPAPNQRVTFVPFTHIEKTTDAEGRFLFDANAEGVSVSGTRVLALVRDLRSKRAAAIELDPRQTNAVLKLEPAWTWTGRVTDPQGAAITNAQAQLQYRNPWTGPAGPTNAESAPRIRDTSMLVPIGTPTLVDTQGRFSFEGLPPGRSFEATFSAPGFGGVQVKGDAPAPGKDRLEAEPIRLPSPTQVLGGTVVDDQGRPVVAASVQYRSERNPGKQRLTDRQGRFFFKGVFPRKAEVTASDFKGRFGTATVEAGDTNVTLRLQTPEQRPRPTTGPR